ncbi:hypothetical protein ACWDRB_47280 [Nonomuraea sp. NPDC003707]
MNELHAYPVGDLIEHDVSERDQGRVHGPETRPVAPDGGSVGWLVMHHSLDGRKALERLGGCGRRVDAGRLPSMIRHSDTGGWTASVGGGVRRSTGGMRAHMGGW